MEVAESIFCLQIQFDYLNCQASDPLVQQDSATKQILEITQSVEVVFSSDRSGDRFTGKSVSATTGLHYEYKRWYDPGTGRFISQDPNHGSLANPQSLNLYVYVTNDPTTSGDPSGLGSWSFWEALGCLIETIVSPPNPVTIASNLIVPTARRIAKKLGDTITTVVDSTVGPLVLSGGQFITGEVRSMTSEVQSITSEVRSVTSEARSILTYHNFIDYGLNTIGNFIKTAPVPSDLRDSLGNFLSGNAPIIDRILGMSGIGPMTLCTTCLISPPPAGVNLGDWSHVSINLNNINPLQAAACAGAGGIIALNFAPPPFDLPDIFLDPILYEFTAYCAGGA